MYRVRGFSNLVKCSRVARPLSSPLLRLFSDAAPSAAASAEEKKEQGDSEVIDFIKKVILCLLVSFIDCEGE